MSLTTIQFIALSLILIAHLMTPIQAMVCNDGCYNPFYGSIVEMRNASINLIERTSDISNSFTAGEPYKDIFDAFDSNISKIGDRIFMNKRLNDVTNLLSYELKYLTRKVLYLRRTADDAPLSWYKDVKLKLHSSFDKTLGLKSDFEKQEQILMKQYKVLHLLHEEIDSVVAGIKNKLEHC